MSKRFIRINDMLYRTRRDKWGLKKLYCMDFYNMVRYTLHQGKRPIYENDDGVLCDRESDNAFNDIIQEHYNNWKEEYINDLLLEKR